MKKREWFKPIGSAIMCIIGILMIINVIPPLGDRIVSGIVLVVLGNSLFNAVEIELLRKGD